MLMSIVLTKHFFVAMIPNFLLFCCKIRNYPVGYQTII
jgi:hypothetical protein